MQSVPLLLSSCFLCGPSPYSEHPLVCQRTPQHMQPSSSPTQLWDYFDPTMFANVNVLSKYYTLRVPTYLLSW